VWVCMRLLSITPHNLHLVEVSFWGKWKEKDDNDGAAAAAAAADEGWRNVLETILFGSQWERRASEHREKKSCSRLNTHARTQRQRLRLFVE
jgi:hypothetical protein